jgi:hypothetical protein
MTYPGLGGQQLPPLGIPQGQLPVLGIQAGVPAPRPGWTPEIFTDATSRSATTGYAQISGSWTIKGSDAVAGAVYKLRFWGSYTAGSVPAIDIQPVIFGTALTALVAAPVSGSSIGFMADAWIIVTAAGASGSVNGMIASVGGEFSFLTTIPATAVNTTVPSTFELQAKISTGTLTGVGSVYERDGPGASN